jgi:predicted MFS family arabinose efflux permease
MPLLMDSLFSSIAFGHLIVDLLNGMRPLYLDRFAHPAGLRIMVVLAQRDMPGGVGLACGLTLGFIFPAGALGTLLSGPLADARGIPVVFQVSTGLVLLAALITAPLQRRTVLLTQEINP